MATAMAPAGLGASLLAALQASFSVLLVIFYGAIAAKLELLNPSSSKSISKICVKMFLPALLLTKIGSELHAGSAHRYVIILIWAFFCHIASFLIGIAAHLLIGLPNWITAAIMFNNTTSYPLLLIQSLDETGILTNLITTNESTIDAIERAKSYFLVFATISSCLTFAVGPRLIDGEHSPDPESKDGGNELDNGQDEEDDGNGHEADEPTTERTSLLVPQSNGNGTTIRRKSVFLSPSRNPSVALESRKGRRAYSISPSNWLKLHKNVQWTLLFLYDFLNAPLIGAILGAIIGLVPVLHSAFFNDTKDGGYFTAWFTASLKSIGGLFVPLPVVIAGVSLYTSARNAKRAERAAPPTPWGTTIFILVIRFVIWPVSSIAIVYALASKTNILGTDPMLWFTMMLMPTGPPAMKLITMLEVSDASEEDEAKVAKLLTVC
jgi:auxin efflux carrier family protein